MHEVNKINLSKTNQYSDLSKTELIPTKSITYMFCLLNKRVLLCTEIFLFIDLLIYEYVCWLSREKCVGEFPFTFSYHYFKISFVLYKKNFVLCKKFNFEFFHHSLYLEQRCFALVSQQYWQEVQRFPYTFYPHTCKAFPIINTSYQSTMLATVDEPTLTHHVTQGP